MNMREGCSIVTGEHIRASFYDNVNSRIEKGKPTTQLRRGQQGVKLLNE